MNSTCVLAAMGVSQCCWLLILLWVAVLYGVASPSIFCFTSSPCDCAWPVYLSPALLCWDVIGWVEDSSASSPGNKSDLLPVAGENQTDKIKSEPEMDKWLCTPHQASFVLKMCWLRPWSLASPLRQKRNLHRSNQHQLAHRGSYIETSTAGIRLRLQNCNSNNWSCTYVSFRLCVRWVCVSVRYPCSHWYKVVVHFFLSIPNTVSRDSKLSIRR